jgi:MraZ protein
MFLGEYSHSLDEKGRLTLPARWREELGSRVVVTRGVEPCLIVFRTEEFEAFMAEVYSVGLTIAATRELSRFFGGKAMDDDIDKQGRINIAANLREYAGLNGECLLVGAYKYVEIWNPQAYAQVNAELERTAKQVSERIGEAALKLPGPRRSE